MAEEKKPKIDLKARLGKPAAGAAPPPPAPVGGVPVPAPGGGAAAPAYPPPPVPPSGPVPGSPIGPPPGFVSPSKPEAPPYRAPEPPPPPPQPQRIEVDEAAVQEAAKASLRKGILIGSVIAVVLGAVGYVAGMSGEANAGRKAAQNHAKSLAGDVVRAKDTLEKIATKVEEGQKSLLKEKKFPDKLANELGGMNVDFDGSKLAGVRFSGFSQEASSGLIEFITQVQSLNDRKLVIINLLNSLQKPINDQFSQGDKVNISYVVLLGKQDPARNPFAVLAPLDAPIAITPPNITLPAEFSGTDVTSGAKFKLPKYATGDLSKPAAMYVAPGSISRNFPSEVSGKIAQLGSQLGRLVTDVKGEKVDPSMVVETKMGLAERADKLAKSLEKIASGK